MPIFLAIPADELRPGETTLQVLDRELFSLAHQDRHRSLAAGCDQDPAEGGVSREVADLLAGLTGVERRIALVWRGHVVTVHFLRGRSMGTRFPGPHPASAGSNSGKSISVSATLFMKLVIRNCADRAMTSMICPSVNPASRIDARSESRTLPRDSIRLLAKPAADPRYWSLERPWRLRAISSGDSWAKWAAR